MKRPTMLLNWFLGILPVALLCVLMYMASFFLVEKDKHTDLRELGVADDAGVGVDIAGRLEPFDFPSELLQVPEQMAIVERRPDLEISIAATMPALEPDQDLKQTVQEVPNAIGNRALVVNSKPKGAKIFWVRAAEYEVSRNEKRRVNWHAATSTSLSVPAERIVILAQWEGREKILAVDARKTNSVLIEAGVN